MSESDSQELTFSIGETADLLGVSIPTIRAYEQRGLLIPMRRSARTHRRYSRRDLDRLRCIRKMIKEEKVSIAGITRLLALIPCWKVINCPPEGRDTCPAFLEHDAPCWAKTRRAAACASAQCRICPVYTDAANCDALKRTIARFTTGTDPDVAPT